MNFFDVLSDVLLKKSGGNLHTDPEFGKSMSVFMLASYLAMRDDLIIYGQILNRYKMSPEQAYKWAYKAVPKQRSGFIKYASKPKKPDSKRRNLDE